MKFTQLHADRLSATLFLVKEFPEHHNQNRWHCGTSHCFAGFGDMVAKFGKVDKDLLTTCTDFENTLTVDRVWFGLTTDAWASVTWQNNTLEILETVVSAAIKGKGKIDFKGIDLSGANLTQVNLEGACLEGVNLTGADLRESYMFQANLKRADLSGANLGNADLLGADLTGAVLKNTNLTGANLRSAKGVNRER